jgi:hypothetical protein
MLSEFWSETLALRDYFGSLGVDNIRTGGIDGIGGIKKYKD